MDLFLFWFYAVAYLALLVWGAVLAQRSGWATPANLPMLVVAGLVYDNTVLAAGQLIGEGPLLEGLSFARFWLHALLTPLLVVFAWYSMKRAGARWTLTTAAAAAAVLVAVALIILELATGVAGLSIAPSEEYGVLSYGNTETGGGPPLMVLLVSVVLLVAAFTVWRKQGWIWFLAGTVLMVAGSAVPIPVESGAVTNAFELILLTSIIATKHRQDQLERQEQLIRAG
jgi:hypothetical protein